MKSRGGQRGGGPVTLIEVEALAGVSASTVSRNLNGTAVISDVKAQAVLQALARLGFVPNPVTRGLAGGRTLSGRPAQRQRVARLRPPVAGGGDGAQAEGAVAMRSLRRTLARTCRRWRSPPARSSCP